MGIGPSRTVIVRTSVGLFWLAGTLARPLFDATVAILCRSGPKLVPYAHPIRISGRARRCKGWNPNGCADAGRSTEENSINGAAMPFQKPRVNAALLLLVGSTLEFMAGKSVAHRIAAPYWFLIQPLPPHIVQHAALRTLKKSATLPRQVRLLLGRLGATSHPDPGSPC